MEWSKQIRLKLCWNHTTCRFSGSLLHCGELEKYRQLCLFKSMQPKNCIQHLHLHFGPCTSEVIRAAAACSVQWSTTALWWAHRKHRGDICALKPFERKNNNMQPHTVRVHIHTWTDIEKKRALIYTKKPMCIWIGHANSIHCLRACNDWKKCPGPLCTMIPALPFSNCFGLIPCFNFSITQIKTPDSLKVLKRNLFFQPKKKKEEEKIKRVQPSCSINEFKNVWNAPLVLIFTTLWRSIGEMQGEKEREGGEEGRKRERKKECEREREWEIEWRWDDGGVAWSVQDAVTAGVPSETRQAGGLWVGHPLLVWYWSSPRLPSPEQDTSGLSN